MSKQPQIVPKKLSVAVAAFSVAVSLAAGLTVGLPVFGEDEKSPTNAETKSVTTTETKSSESKTETKTAETKDEHKGGGESCMISDPGQSAPIKFSCTNTHPNCSESEKVIETLSLYAKAYVHQDYKTCAEYMTNDITTFDLRSHKLIVGKEAVLADMKARLDKSAPGTDSPLLSYTIDHPLAQVKGNKACVNCIGIKVYGGKHPRTVESHSNYVFLKEDGKWKKSHFTTDWKKVN